MLTSLFSYRDKNYSFHYSYCPWWEQAFSVFYPYNESQCNPVLFWTPMTFILWAKTTEIFFIISFVILKTNFSSHYSCCPWREQAFSFVFVYTVKANGVQCCFGPQWLSLDGEKKAEVFFKLSFLAVHRRKNVKQCWNNMSFLFKRRRCTLPVKRQMRQCLNFHLIAQLSSFLPFSAGFASVQTAGIIKYQPNVGIISPGTIAEALSPLMWTGLFANWKLSEHKIH